MKRNIAKVRHFYVPLKAEWKNTAIPDFSILKLAFSFCFVHGVTKFQKSVYICIGI